MTTIKAVRVCVLLVIAAVASGAAAQPAERLYYHYVDSNGNRVIEDRITEGALTHGYTVKTRYGKVVKKVPPRPTAEELAARKAERERAEADEKAAQQREAWDKYLLLRYSSVDDINGARDRALNQIQVRIDILKSNLVSLQQTVAQEQEKAAARQRRTGKVDDPEHDALMEAFNSEMVELERQIAGRQRELEETRSLYSRDVSRFEEIMGSAQARN